MEAEKKRQQDAIRQAAAFKRSLKEYGNVQSHMQLEIERLKAMPEKITVYFSLQTLKIRPNFLWMKKHALFKKNPPVGIS